ncbi:hypothetical protein ACPWT1_08185 [Ramlibacter sp. MMS24-I3-19]|uniref:hypothetical protein n=1 Tax=Ramlibacter sp. MMS24-I3-19 TaxID=3416606 RepID=UPI003D033119
MKPLSLWWHIVRLTPGTYLQHSLVWSAVFGMPILIGYVASRVVATSGRDGLVAAFLALCLIRGVIVTFGDRLEVTLTHRTMGAYRKALVLSVSTSLAAATRARANIGQLLASFQRDTNAVATFACASSITLSRTAFLVVAFAWLVRINAPAAVFAASATIVGSFVVARLTAIASRQSKQVEVAAGEDTHLLHSILGAASSIATTGTAGAFTKVLARSYDRRTRVGASLSLGSAAQQQFPVLLLSLPVAAMFLDARDASDASSVLLAITLLGFVADNAAKLTRIAFLYVQASEAVERLHGWRVAAAAEDKPEQPVAPQFDAGDPMTVVAAAATEQELITASRLSLEHPGILVSDGRFSFNASALENLLREPEEIDPDLFLKWYRALGFTHDFPGTETFEAALAQLARTPYANLSGGQADRLLCLRVLLSGTRVIAGWEPFTGVDAKTLHSLVQNLQGGGVRQIYVSGGGRIIAPTDR